MNNTMNAYMNMRQSVSARGYKTLISTDSLVGKINNRTADNLVVLDCTFSSTPDEAYKDKYLQSHIPGAKFFNHHQCVTSTSLIPRNIPEPYCFTKKLRYFGISSDTEVIVYDRGSTPAYAARVWWLLRLFGHERVSILDGGLVKWTAEGHDVHSAGTSQSRAGQFSPCLNTTLIQDRADILHILGCKSSQIVDARGPQYFTGAMPHSADLPGGHIPGAKNVPNKSLYNEDGTFKTPNEIKAVFKANGVDLTKPMVSMCRTGILASSLASAAHVAGKEDVPVYYGSWMEWAQAHPHLIAMDVDKTQG